MKHFLTNKKVCDSAHSLCEFAHFLHGLGKFFIFALKVFGYHSLQIDVNAFTFFENVFTNFIFAKAYRVSIEILKKDENRCHCCQRDTKYL